MSSEVLLEENEFYYFYNPSCLKTKQVVPRISKVKLKKFSKLEFSFLKLSNNNLQSTKSIKLKEVAASTYPGVKIVEGGNPPEILSKRWL